MHDLGWSKDSLLTDILGSCFAPSSRLLSIRTIIPRYVSVFESACLPVCVGV